MLPNEYEDHELPQEAATTILVLREALKNAAVAVELIHMQVQGTPGIDMTSQQVANVLNSTMALVKAALGEEAK